MARIAELDTEGWPRQRGYQGCITYTENSFLGLAVPAFLRPMAWATESLGIANSCLA